MRLVLRSLAIEGNTLTAEQITAVLEGKPVIALPREIQEARNAIIDYETLGQWQPANQYDLLNAHQTLIAKKGLRTQ